MKKVLQIATLAVPIVLMLVLIPLVPDDYILALFYVVIIAVLLIRRYEAHDFTALALGIIIMTIGEVVFVSTGVETFSRTSLFGIMPLWLPILWGYGFVAVKRAVKILG